jgi:protein ImuA
MLSHPGPMRREVGEKIEELRRNPALFSFRKDVPGADCAIRGGLAPELGIRPGGIVEWLAAQPGAGAVTSAFQIMARSAGDLGDGVWVIVDPARECYLPGLSGWGVNPGRTLVLRPTTIQETCWAIEQCLRCPGVSATWAWLDRPISARVSRRWQLAAEIGGGTGLFFRPAKARREAVWADLRLLVKPRAGGEGETRRVQIEVLYRRGGLGGSTLAWEIDHAAGIVRPLPQVAPPATADRAARA